MAASPHDTQLPLRPQIKEGGTIEIFGSSSTPSTFPAELLLSIARYTEDTEDLQSLRLVSRAFSHAATTALHDRFTRIFVLPLQSSMARFTRLTENPLIGPKIRRVIVIYGPPITAFDFPRACLGVDMHYGMKLQNLKDIMSDYNERFTDSRPADNDSTFRTVVDSGEFERVLGEGLQRLLELRSLFICSDALCSPGGTSPFLNLPEFLQLDIV